MGPERDGLRATRRTGPGAPSLRSASRPFTRRADAAGRVITITVVRVQGKGK